MSKKIAIIGSGFSSLSAAAYLAKKNFKVHVYEKNKTFGGRARQLKKQGFTFDMGPSWYWMPDVFESFYNDFDKTTSDFYKLDRLDPGYQVVFGENERILIGDSLEKIFSVFEKEEKGSSIKLKRFINIAKEKAKLEEYSISNYPKSEKKPWELILEALNESASETFIEKELGDYSLLFKEVKTISKSRGIQARLPYTIRIE